MASNIDPANQQYGAGAPLFGLDGAAYANTGADGSPGVQDSAPGVGGGGVIASPVVSVPFGSSQVAANMPALPVTAGDTSGFTDDTPIHPSALLPGSADSYLSTGAGDGDANPYHHPGAGR